MKDKTTFLGRRIGYNEERRKRNRAQKMKDGSLSFLRWFKKRGWLIVIVVVVLSAIAWNNRFYIKRFNPMELRYLQYIDIEGNRLLTWEEIIQNARIEMGMKLNEVVEDSVEKNLMILPLVHKVKVKKHFPSSLSIIIEESSPIVSYFEGGKPQVFSERGLLLPVVSAIAYNLPIVDSLALEHIVEISNQLDKLKQNDKFLYDQISQISYSEKEQAYEIFFSDVGYKVLLPNGEWNKHIWDLLKSVKHEFVNDLKCAGIVDLRFDNFLYVKKFDKRCENG